MHLPRKPRSAPLGPQWVSGGVPDFGPGKTTELLGPLEMEEPTPGLINNYRDMVGALPTRTRRAAVAGASALSVVAGAAGLATGAMSIGPAATAILGGQLLPLAAYELEQRTRKQ
jgi:hypothetical protein